MTAPTTTQLRKTALHSVHRRLGAKMVDFGGWDMPVEYSGIVREHLATRTAAGLFDVSHMGEIEVRGPHALDLVQYVTCNDAAKLARRPGAIFRADDRGRHVCGRSAGAPHLRYALPAVRQRQQSGQGLRLHSRAQSLRRRGGKRRRRAIRNWRFRDRRRSGSWSASRRVPIGQLKYYHFTFGEVDGVHCLIARTGYTGEDGFEFYFSPEHSEKLWNDLLEAGRGDGLLPAAWARAIRCAWKRPCAFTDTRLTTRRRCGKRNSAGSANSIRAIFSGAMRCSRRNETASSAAGRLRDAGPADRARRLPRAHRRARGRPRDQRLARAVSEEKYRHGLRAGGIERRWARRFRSPFAATQARAKIVPLPFYKRAK